MHELAHDARAQSIVSAQRARVAFGNEHNARVEFAGEFIPQTVVHPAQQTLAAIRARHAHGSVDECALAPERSAEER